MHHDSHKHLIVALTEFQGHSESDAISLKSGDVFLADAGMEELVNDGPAEARMLIVEIKN